MNKEQGKGRTKGEAVHLWGLFLCVFFLSLIISSGRAEAKGRLRALFVSGEASFSYDAKYMAQALLESKSTTFHVSRSDVTVTVGTAGNTISKLNARIDKAFGKSREGDLNFFFFTGHGYLAGNSNHFSLNEVKGPVIAPENRTIYPYGKLARKLASYKGQMLVVMDSCFSQAFYLKGVRKLPKKAQKKFTLMLSSRWSEKSYASVLAGGAYISIFTYYFLDAVGFWATYGDVNCDMDGDRYASLREIASYISDFMKLKEQKMTPCIYLLSGKNLRLYA